MPTMKLFLDSLKYFSYADYVTVGLLLAIFLLAGLIFIRLGSHHTQTREDLAQAQTASQQRIAELEAHFMAHSEALMQVGHDINARQNQTVEALTKLTNTATQTHHALGDSRNIINQMQESIEKQGVYMYDKFAALSKERPAESAMVAAINDLRTQMAALPAGTELHHLHNEILELSRLLAMRGDGGRNAQQQLADLLSQMLPAEQYSLDEILPNGAHVSALVRFPAPQGAIAIDAGVSLKAYHDSLPEHLSVNERSQRQRNFGDEVIRRINHVADMLITPPHTGDSALLFVPSEAAFADIHARHRQAVDLAVSRRVWLVSPTTLLAVLNTAHTRAAMLEIMREAENFGHRLAEIGVNVASPQIDNQGTRLAEQGSPTNPTTANPKNQFIP